MLKKISIRKLIISFSALFTLFLIYLIPNNENDKNKLEDIPQELEYVNNDLVTSSVFLLDSYNMLGKTEVPVSSKDIESLAKELLEVLINGGANEDRIPNGFKSILPSDTKILSLKYDKDLIKVDFSKELLNTSKEMEEKVVEAIIYTLTSINGVNKVIIYVDGNILTKLPQTKINLPSTLDRSFGINKEYDINSIKDINQVTIYYVNKNNDNYYYVPVTKYLNDDRDKIKIVIDELSGNSIYNTNLMSFLNSNAELISSEKKDDLMHLNFNEYIFSDIEEKNILGENQFYYVIRMPGEVKVMVPTDRAEQIGVRNVIGKEEAEKVISILGEDETEMSQNWNKRYRDNMEKMKSGSVYEVADVVRNLSFKQKEKGLSTGEKKMLSNAKQILVSELVLAEHASQDEVEELINNKINLSFNEYRAPQAEVDINTSIVNKFIPFDDNGTTNL